MHHIDSICATGMRRLERIAVGPCLERDLMAFTLASSRARMTDMPSGKSRPGPSERLVLQNER